MSLILDALNKADHERKQNQEETPGIDATHGTPFTQAEQKRIKRRWIFASIAVFVSLLISVYFLGRSSNPELTSQPEKTEKVAANPIISAPRQNESKIEQATKTDSKQTLTQKLIEAQYQKASEKLASTNVEKIEKAEKKEIINTKTPQKTEATTTTKPVAAPKTNDIGNLYAKAAEPTAPPITPTPTPKPIPTPQDTLDSFPNIGYIRELSYSEQQEVPTLMYSDHQFKGNNSSTVTLNGKKIRRGKNAAPGVVVDQILSDGVILKFKNTKFKMDAYSSWVNM